VQTNIYQEIDKISNLLILKEAFYAHFFSGMLKNVSEELPTLAVKARQMGIWLHINPTFWQQELRTPEHKYGAIKHEILHILLLHIFRYKEFKHQGIFNVAADLVVNQLIDRKELIDEAVFLELFPELRLQTNQTLNYYYQKLYDLYEKKTKEEQGGVELKPNISWENLKSLLKEEALSQQQHAFWKYFEGLSSAEKELLQEGIKQKIYEVIRRTRSKEFGKLPAGLQNYLDEFEKSMQPSVNWRRILRLFANSSAKTFIRNTLKRPSKRYGTTPGIKIKHRNKILVAVDTSGSLMEEDLKSFFQEIYHIWKQGAEIMVVECDTIIQQSYKYKGKNPKFVKGGGGTDFNAPIRYANTTFLPDALIYFTDGYCEPPKEFCRCPLLWLLSSAGIAEKDFKGFQGRVLKMS
jgi:predicted metal-dependent peptidase